MLLNTTEERRKAVKQCLENEDWNGLKEAMAKVLLDAELAMTDTLSRFWNTAQYQEYKKKQAAQAEASKQLGWTL